MSYPVNPLVSVCMITYNHEKYISQAIEGVLFQKTEFPIELVIGEDCSTDSTGIICKEYADKYSTIIRFLPSEINLGMMSNFRRTLNSCTGKYIALCEGDDYWIDPNKLQLQVQTLEQNKTLSACFHDCGILDESNGSLINNGSRANKYRKIIFTTNDLISDWCINTCTVVFKKEGVLIPEIFNEHLIDRLLLQLISLNGPILYLRKQMAVYRKHPNGISRNKYTGTDIEKIELRWDKFNYFTKYTFNKEIQDAKKMLALEYTLTNKELNKSIIVKSIFKNLRLLFNKNQKSWLRTLSYLAKAVFEIIVHK